MNSATPALPIQVQLRRRYAAPCARIYDAWLTPRMLGMWMFDARTVGGTPLCLDVDPIGGGTLRVQVRRGGAVIDHFARFQVLEPARRIDFSWATGMRAGADAAQVRLMFEEDAHNTCRLTLTHRMAARWDGSQDRVRAGWQGYLDGLQALFDPVR